MMDIKIGDAVRFSTRTGGSCADGTGVILTIDGDVISLKEYGCTRYMRRADIAEVIKDRQ
jgi:hypothetical protein